MSRAQSKARAQRALIGFLPAAHPMAEDLFGEATLDNLMTCAQHIVLCAMRDHIGNCLTDIDQCGIQ